MEKGRKKKGFTLIELMVVILVVGVLASLSIPILRERAEQSKWSEGAATAGGIKTAVKALYAEEPVTVGAWAGQAVPAVEATLGFQAGELTGRYFTSANFTIASVDAQGNAVIAVAAPAGLQGSGVLSNAGWIYTP